MSEIIELGLKQWENVSSDQLGLTLPGLRIDRTRYTNDKKQQFNILDIDARNGKPGPTILASNSYDFRGQPLFDARMSILAAHANARVMASEIPGVTINRDHPFDTHGDFQTPKQTILAFSGDFDPLATEQFKAMYEVGQLNDDDEYHLFGESLGAYAAVAMARSMAQGKLFGKKFHISRMDLVEPVNAYGNYSVLRQLKMLHTLATTEDQRRQLYLAENTQIGHPFGAYEKISPETMRADKHVKRRQIIATYATGAGLRKGLHTALEDALHDAPELRAMHIGLSRTVDSTVSFETDLQSAAHTIIKSGGRASTYLMTGETNDTVPIGHSVLDSLGRMASYTDARQRDLLLKVRK